MQAQRKGHGYIDVFRRNMDIVVPLRWDTGTEVSLRWDMCTEMSSIWGMDRTWAQCYQHEDISTSLSKDGNKI